MPHSSCVLFRITSNDLAIYSVTRSIARSFCDGWVTMMMMMMMMMLMLLLLLQISRSRQCCPTSCEWRTEPRSSSRRRWWRWHRRHRTWSVSVTKYRQRKTASSRLIPRSSICIMNLSALWITPFCTGMDWPAGSQCGRVHAGTEMVSPHGQHILAYGQRSSPCGRANVGEGQTQGRIQRRSRGPDPHFQWSNFFMSTRVFRFRF